MDVYTTADRATLHALNGLKKTHDLRLLYTPHARGIQKQCFVVPSSEFMKTSSPAMKYEEFLTLSDTSGVFEWMKWLHLVSQKIPLKTLNSYESLQYVANKYIPANFNSWSIPTFYTTEGDILQTRQVSFVEYKKLHGLSVFATLQHLMHIVLFGFPVVRSFVMKLRLNKIIGLYVRARLFQGIFDRNYPSSYKIIKGFSSHYLKKNQFVVDSLEHLNGATSMVELENMLYQTSFIGSDSEPLFALARRDRFKLLGNTPIGEYMQYVRRCEEIPCTPVGFKIYQEIIHPIKSAPSQVQLRDFAF